jgi:hypothetical protein
MLFLEGDNVAETNKVKQNFQSMVSEPIRPAHAVATMATKNLPTPALKCWTKAVIKYKYENRKLVPEENVPLKLNESTANVESVLKTLNELYKDQFVLLDSKKLKISDNSLTRGILCCFFVFFLSLSLCKQRQSLLVGNSVNHGCAGNSIRTVHPKTKSFGFG